MRLLPDQPYLTLTDEQRDAVHDFLTAHGIDYHAVPLGAWGIYNAASDTWKVEVLVRNDRERVIVDRATGNPIRSWVEFPAQVPYDHLTFTALVTLGWWPEGLTPIMEEDPDD